MLGIRAWSARRKAVAAATLAFLLWFPTGLSESSGPIVTGHSTYYKGKEFDPCLASVVGVMQTDVRWFNDQVLARRYGGKGTFVYITEHGAEDPREWDRLYSDGVTYDFVDPNGAAWHVEELYHGGIGVSAGGLNNPKVTEPNGWVDPTYIPERTYVWVVELSAQPIYDQFAEHLNRNDPNWHTVYNFVALVDTCRFHRNEDTNYNGIQDGVHQQQDHDFNVTHDANNTTSNQWMNGHKPTDGTHTHEAFRADIYIGKRPLVVIAGAEDTTGESSTWESSWTTSSQSQANAQRVPTETVDDAQGGAP